MTTTGHRSPQVTLQRGNGRFSRVSIENDLCDLCDLWSPIPKTNLGARARRTRAYHTKEKPMPTLLEHRKVGISLDQADIDRLDWVASLTEQERDWCRESEVLPWHWDILPKRVVEAIWRVCNHNNLQRAYEDVWARKRRGEDVSDHIFYALARLHDWEEGWGPNWELMEKKRPKP